VIGKPSPSANTSASAPYANASESPSSANISARLSSANYFANPTGPTVDECVDEPQKWCNRAGNQTGVVIVDTCTVCKPSCWERGFRQLVAADIRAGGVLVNVCVDGGL
jgi:hypothetical protein